MWLSPNRLHPRPSSTWTLFLIVVPLPGPLTPSILQPPRVRPCREGSQGWPQVGHTQPSEDCRCGRCLCVRPRLPLFTLPDSVVTTPLCFIHISGLKEPVAGKAEHREVPSSDHSANKEAGPSLPAGIQRPEWNCKHTSNHTLFQY